MDSGMLTITLDPTDITSTQSTASSTVFASTTFTTSAVPSATGQGRPQIFALNNYTYPAEANCAADGRATLAARSDYGVAVTPITRERWSSVVTCCQSVKGDLLFQSASQGASDSSNCISYCLPGPNPSVAELYNCFFRPNTSIPESGLTCRGQSASDCQRNSTIIDKPTTTTSASTTLRASTTTSAAPSASTSGKSSAGHVNVKGLGLIALVLGALPLAL